MAYYYPKSQVKTNLYTNGGEYMTSQGKVEYIGYYYEVSNGKKYIGKSPQGQPSVLLIPMGSPQTLETPPPNTTIIYKPNHDSGESYLSPDGLIINEDYRELTGIGNERSIPLSYYSQPTEEEEEIGEYRRYFAKKTNELIYIEISKETYTKFKSKDPTVAFDLYECLNLPWSLTDNSNEVNKNIVSLIERNNEWYGFSQYFQDNFGNENFFRIFL
jgi:hypothetical protein